MRALALIAALAACGTDAKPLEPPVFPADYASSYTEVRNCRGPSEHDLMYIRVLASPDAVTAYQGRTAPFPTGSIVIKEEYDVSDMTCSGAIQVWTVMEKLDDASSPGTLDWHWQKVDSHRTTKSVDDPTCINCHTTCTPTGSRGGYDFTCTAPP